MQAALVPPVLIDRSQLRPGDILLSCGDEALSELIRRLGGGDYSHAAVWDGKCAVDATEKGIVRRDLDKDIKAQWYIDAYRWHSPSPPPPSSATDLGNPPYPFEPVIARSDRIVADGTQFAYDELFMAALVVTLSDEPDDEWLRKAVRMLLGRTEEWVHDHVTSRGKTVMTCSQTVAVSFDEASPANYTIEFDVARHREFETFTLGPAPQNLSSYGALKRRYAELVAEAAPAIAQGIQTANIAPQGLGPGISLPSGSVTPHDLQTSPSLRLLGRLSERRTRPSVVDESTFLLFMELVRDYLPNPLKTLSRSEETA